MTNVEIKHRRSVEVEISSITKLGLQTLDIVSISKIHI